jgi:tetratricopeptide (TPR) repeat protein
MNCPSCGHTNLSDFPFCEQCLTLLPERPEARPVWSFDLEDPGGGDHGERRSDWPPFPWNPSDLPNPLIGRERSLKELKTAWDEVVKTWTTRIHLLTGEYGIGKGRLATELARYAIGIDSTTRVVRVACSSSSGPYRLWDLVIRQLFEIPEAAHGPEARACLQSALEARPEGRGAEAARMIGWLLGYDRHRETENLDAMEREAQVGRASGALIRVLDGLSKERPLLIIADDANRVPASSLALAGAIEATLKDRPLMLLLAGSRELRSILPGWDGYPATAMERLGKREAMKLLKLLLTGLEQPAPELMNRLIERSRGNAFALKAMVRFLQEAGGIREEEDEFVIDPSVLFDLVLPEDLEGSILATCGALPEDERGVLLKAAAIGEEFWLGALVALERDGHDAMADPGAIRRDGIPRTLRAVLDRLIIKRLIDSSESAFPGETGYRFKSEVHHRIVSDLLPVAAAQRYHKVIHAWLELHAGPEGDRFETELARHAEASGATKMAARYYLKAAIRESERHHSSQARRLLEKALGLVGAEDAATRVAIGQRLGDLRVVEGDPEGALVAYQEALAVAWQMRHRGHGAEALARIGRVQADRGRFAQAYEHLLAALRLFEATENHAGVASTCNHLGRMLWLKGSLEDALKAYRKAERLFSALGDRGGVATSVHAIAAIYYDRGELGLAEEYYMTALGERRRLEDLTGVARTLNDLGVVRVGADQVESGLQCWREALGLAEETGDRATEATILGNLGEGLVKAGRAEEAESYFVRALEAAKAIDAPRLHANVCLSLAALRSERGQLAEAEVALLEAQRIAAALDLPRLTASVQRAHGDLWAVRAKAPGQDPKGIALAWREAQNKLRGAVEAFERGGYVLEAALSREQLATALDAAGRMDEARTQRDLATRARTGARISTPTVRS